MPLTASRRRKVIFKPRNMPSTDDIAQPQVVEDPGAPIDGHTRIEELSTATEEEESEPSSDSEDDDGMNVHGWMGAKVPGKVPGKVPALYTTRPILKDELVTPTSIAQDKVVEEVLPFMSGKDPEILELNSHGLPALLRRKHIKFCQYGLGKFPSQFQAMDASRPWLLYWNLAAMSFLGEDLGRWRERYLRYANNQLYYRADFSCAVSSRLSPQCRTLTAGLGVVTGSCRTALHHTRQHSAWRWWEALISSTDALCMYYDTAPVRILG